MSTKNWKGRYSIEFVDVEASSDIDGLAVIHANQTPEQAP
jgi:hypothetical protein